MKKYIVFAGVNGAGKSTLYRIMPGLKEIERVNSDEIVKNFGDWQNPNDVLKAGKYAVRKIAECFENNMSFNQETTLCGKSILRNIQKAKLLNYFIELHYVGVDQVETAKKRIAYRVAHGGHGIPLEFVERRYSESLANMKKVIGFTDLAVVYDNTVRFNRIAIYINGKLNYEAENLPEWYKSIFKK